MQAYEQRERTRCCKNVRYDIITRQMLPGMYACVSYILVCWCSTSTNTPVRVYCWYDMHESASIRVFLVLVYVDSSTYSTCWYFRYVLTCVSYARHMSVLQCDESSTGQVHTCLRETGAIYYCSVYCCKYTVLRVGLSRVTLLLLLSACSSGEYR